MHVPPFCVKFLISVKILRSDCKIEIVEIMNADSHFDLTMHTLTKKIIEI